MPKCKDAIAVNRPTCIKDPNGTCTLLDAPEVWGGEGWEGEVEGVGVGWEVDA